MPPWTITLAEAMYFVGLYAIQVVLAFVDFHDAFHLGSIGVTVLRGEFCMPRFEVL